MSPPLMRMAVALILSAVASFVAPASNAAMHGLGFNSLSDWPEDSITHVRVWDSGAAWCQIHSGVDSYDWTALDAEVAQAEAMYPGVSILYTIGGCPLWLAKYPDNPNYAAWLGPGSNSMPSDIDEFNKFVWNLATRYAGRIAAYEVWNEPQLADFLYPYDSDDLAVLAQMTARAYSTIKSCDPSALVLSGSLLPRASSGGMTKASKYLAALQADGWNVDGFSTHIYPNNGEGADSWQAMLADCQATLAALGAPSAGNVWVTETTYNLLGDVVPEADAPALVNATYAAAAAQGVGMVFWYGWDQGASLGGLQLSPSSAAWAAIKAN